MVTNYRLYIVFFELVALHYFPDRGDRNASLIGQRLELQGKLVHFVRRLGTIPGQTNLP